MIPEWASGFLIGAAWGLAFFWLACLLLLPIFVYSAHKTLQDILATLREILRHTPKS